MIKDSLIGMILAVMGIPLLLGAPPVGLALIAIGVGLEVRARRRYCTALQRGKEAAVIRAFKGLP